jgi:hypothetical protein
MFNIESKIRRSVNEFDFAEPPIGHEALFKSKLRKQSGKSLSSFLRQSFLLKVAAIFLLGISIPGVYFLFSESKPASQLPQELSDARMFYYKIADQKLIELEQLAESTPSADETVKVAHNEVKKLKSESNLLQKQYLASGNDQRVFDAFLYNLKSTVNLLETLLSQARQMHVSNSGINP